MNPFFYFLSILSFSFISASASAATTCDARVGYSMEECQECEDVLGLYWGSVCQGANFGTIHYGCHVGYRDEKCPEGWKFEFSNPRDGRVCGKTELFVEYDPSGC